MAYPPKLPPTNRTDSTISADNHAKDHNQLAAAARDLIAVLGANPAGGYSNLTERLLGIAGGASPQVVAAFTQAVADAQAAQQAAEAAAAEAADRVVEDLGTTDAQTRALIEAPGSLTKAALAASFGTSEARTLTVVPGVTKPAMGIYPRIADALADMEDGYALVLAPGEHVTAPLLIEGLSNFSIMANGARIVASATNAPMLKLVNCSDFQIVGGAYTGIATSRNSSGYGITIRFCDRWTCSGVSVTKSAAAGFFIEGGSHWALNDPIVGDNFADGVHVTKAATSFAINSPRTFRTGDDGVAIVSYLSDGAPCRDFTITGPHVTNSGARGVAIVGGTSGQVLGGVVRGAQGSGVLVFRDAAYATYGPSQIVVDGTIIHDANRNAAVDNAGIQVSSASLDYPAEDIAIRNTLVSGARWRSYSAGAGSTQGTRRITFSGCRARNGGAAHDAFCVTRVYRADIVDCEASGTGAHAFFADEHSSHVTVVRCVADGISGGLGGAFQIRAQGVVMEGNRVLGNTATLVRSFTLSMATELHYGKNQPAQGKGVSLPASAREALVARDARSDALPSEGIWAPGDRVWHATPVPGGTMGWVCTKAGRAAPAWTPSTTYVVGAIVTNGATARTYRCLAAGTSAATGGPSGTAATITDGDVTWEWTGDLAVSFSAFGAIAGTP